MKRLEANRLPDESLENVTGGTNQEMLTLQHLIGADNLADVKKKLKELGIEGTLSSKNDNSYFEVSTHRQLSHEEVIKRLKKV